MCTRKYRRCRDPFEYYIPKTEEEFVNYGRLECQEPNENTVFFIQTMMFEFHKNQAEALQIFYEGAGFYPYELSGGRNHFPALSAWLLFLFTEAGGGYEKEIRRLGCMTRCWDYKGHMGLK
ncbi:MAG: hypothetical protein ACLR6B_06660 [Blautia sp.]